MNRAVWIALFVCLACGEQSFTLVSGDKTEQKMQNPGVLFKRGPMQIGQTCSVNRDCDSLQCIGGYCGQDCLAAACPDNTACYITPLKTSCMEDQDCAQLSACEHRNCGCSEDEGGQGECIVFPYCYAVCDRDESCPAQGTTCRADPDMMDNTKLCLPDRFFSQPPPPPPPPMGSSIGDACMIGQCTGPMFCDDTYDQGYCTQQCMPGDCPMGSVCDEGLCRASCSMSGAMCGNGSICVDVDGSLICL